MTKGPGTVEIAIPIGRGPSGNPAFIRIRGDDSGPKTASMGVLHPLKEGQPILPGSELVRLTPGENGGPLRCETLYESEGSSGGWRPLSVSQEGFASNWDSIFGASVSENDAPPSVDDLLN